MAGTSGGGVSEWRTKILEERAVLGFGSCPKCFDKNCEELEIPSLMTKREDQDLEYCESCGHCKYDISLAEEEKEKPSGTYIEEHEAIQFHRNCLQRIRAKKEVQEKEGKIVDEKDQKFQSDEVLPQAPGGPAVSDKEILITFKTLTGRSINLSVPADWTTTDLIFAISRTRNCIQSRKIIHASKQMETNDIKLTSFGITNGSVVHLIDRLRGS